MCLWGSVKGDKEIAIEQVKPLVAKSAIWKYANEWKAIMKNSQQ